MTKIKKNTVQNQQYPKKKMTAAEGQGRAIAETCIRKGSGGQNNCWTGSHQESQRWCTKRLTQCTTSPSSKFIERDCQTANQQEAEGWAKMWVFNKNGIKLSPAKFDQMQVDGLLNLNKIDSKCHDAIAYN